MAPGAPLAGHLRPLGWAVDADLDGPVRDDYCEVIVREPAPASPAALQELWRLCRTAFATTPPAGRDLDVEL